MRTGVTMMPTEAMSSRELTPSLAFGPRAYGLYIMLFMRRSAFRGQCTRSGTGSASIRHATCRHRSLDEPGFSTSSLSKSRQQPYVESPDSEPVCSARQQDMEETWRDGLRRHLELVGPPMPAHRVQLRMRHLEVPVHDLQAQRHTLSISCSGDCLASPGFMAWPALRQKVSATQLNYEGAQLPHAQQSGREAHLGDVLLDGAAVKANARRLHGGQLHGRDERGAQAAPEGVRLGQAAQLARVARVAAGAHVHAHALAVLPHPAVLRRASSLL